MDYEYDVFISYKNESEPTEWLEKCFLEKFEYYLKAETGKKKIEIFYDKSSIENGDDWERRILTSLSKSRCLVSILCPLYFESEWCVREFQLFNYHQKKLGFLSDENPRGLIFPFTIWDGDSFPDYVKKVQIIHECRDYFYTGDGFLRSDDYFKFQQKLKEWIKPIAFAINNAPPWQEDSFEKNLPNTFISAVAFDENQIPMPRNKI